MQNPESTGYKNQMPTNNYGNQPPGPVTAYAVQEQAPPPAYNQPPSYNQTQPMQQQQPQRGNYGQQQQGNYGQQQQGNYGQQQQGNYNSNVVEYDGNNQQQPQFNQQQQQQPQYNTQQQQQPNPAFAQPPRQQYLPSTGVPYVQGQLPAGKRKSRGGGPNECKMIGILACIAISIFLTGMIVISVSVANVAEHESFDLKPEEDFVLYPGGCRVFVSSVLGTVEREQCEDGAEGADCLDDATYYECFDTFLFEFYGPADKASIDSNDVFQDRDYVILRERVNNLVPCSSDDADQIENPHVEGEFSDCWFPTVDISERSQMSEYYSCNNDRCGKIINPEEEKLLANGETVVAEAGMIAFGVGLICISLCCCCCVCCGLGFGI